MRRIVFIISIFAFSFLSFPTFSQKVEINGSSTVAYLLSHQKSNAGFGPYNKEYTDLAWTYPAVYALKLLKEPIPKKEECFSHGHQSWMEKNPWKNGPWYWSFYQKANLYKLYNKRDEFFEKGVNRGQDWVLKFKHRKGYIEFRDYPQGEFFDTPSLWHMVGALKLLDGKVKNPDYINDYLTKRQTASGGFVDDVTDDPKPTENRAHLIITYDAVMTLNSLGISIPNASDCIKWIQACQTPSGGFKWSPVSKEYSNKPDVWYTWAAIKALKVLGARPKDVVGCQKWLNSLQNADGGFADKPGWNSRIYSTFYAVQALDILTGDARSAVTDKILSKTEKVIPEGVYSIFQAHQKSPSGGKGMVDSIASMKLNLIGVKSKEKDVVLGEGISQSVKEARTYAKRKGYPLEILEFPENYSHNLYWKNGQKANHVSNFLIPPNLSPKEGRVYEAAFKAGQSGLSWQEFKNQVIKPVQSLGKGTLFYPELDYTMVNAYMVYDDGLDGHLGYNAVPGAHFGNIDWVRHFPYKERWEGVLPIMADGDAHANIVKWRPNLEQYRNVYIAKDYDFNHYIDASLNNRSVCVIHMPTGEVRYYGGKAAIAYLKKHKNEWQWW